MNVNLTPELEQLVQTKVISGRYNSASEVVREALRLMEHDLLKAMKVAEMRRNIADGVSSLRVGTGTDDKSFFELMDAALGQEIMANERANTVCGDFVCLQRRLRTFVKSHRTNSQ